MSRLQELIDKLCPDGVHYKKMWELTIWDKKFNSVEKHKQADVKKYTYLLAADLKSLQTDGGTVKILTTSISDLWTDEKLVEDIVSEEEIVCIPWGGNPIVQYYKGKFVTGDNRIAVVRDSNELNTKYLYYYLQKNILEIASFYRGSGIKHPDMSKVLDMSVPVPPLEVQREIVQILDKFTLLTDELTDELTARKKQYEYYRENLYSFDDSVEYKTMDELFPFIRNGFVGTIKPYFTDAENGVRYLEGTNIHNGVISDNEVLYVTKEFHNKHIKNELKSDDILMVQSGHIGECAVVGEKYKGANCHALIIMSNGGKCLSEYIVHYFHTAKGYKALTPAITGGTIKHVLAGKMGKIKVPVPNIKRQEEIVELLSKYEELINDISSGLPAEIEARRKQYEYYRDKLLSFKELV